MMWSSLKAARKIWAMSPACSGPVGCRENDILAIIESVN